MQLQTAASLLKGKRKLDVKSLVLAEAAALKEYHEKRSEVRNGEECDGILTQISNLRNTEEKAVGQCHSASLAFKSAYSTILYPKFAVDQGMVSKGGGSGALPKDWKGPGARLAHARLRSKAVRKLGLLGKVVVNVSEACSTMMCPFCMTLSSPGKWFIYIFYYLHRCSSHASLSQSQVQRDFVSR